jgi:hypothetical protein
MWVNMLTEPAPGYREIHVIPDFGRPHELWIACWCHPDQDEEAQNVFKHHVEN